MQRLIFLDFDGVLNTTRNVARLRAEGQSLSDEFGYLFDAEAVANLQTIIEQTDAEIVVSSSWKFEGLERMRQLWQARRLPGRLLDITPDYLGCIGEIDPSNPDTFVGKGNEIKAWLERQAAADCRYVILDDTPDVLASQRENYIQINDECGITAADAKRAIEILIR